MTQTSKIALVTGANKGIGLAAAAIMARDYNFMVLLGARDEERGKEAAEELQNHKLNVQYLPLNVADEDSVRSAMREVEREFGRLDVLVNNAAINLDGGRGILQVTPDEFRNTFETNVLGVLRVTQSAWPLLMAASSPRVVNVSSGIGRLYDMEHEMPAYSTSKTALNALTRQFAGLGAGRVSVNSINPGWVRTDMGGQNAHRSPDEGAAIIVKLATMENPPTGEFLQDSGQIGW